MTHNITLDNVLLRNVTRYHTPYMMKLHHPTLRPPQMFRGEEMFAYTVSTRFTSQLYALNTLFCVCLIYALCFQFNFDIKLVFTQISKRLLN